ncbi:DUF3592 domain-containing protein [Actinomadura sp. WMMA1423]|uniref:DUF3592 domain-containing protein n=1 Tax=Actinomadura sp. WMMA1423 TaxID=2591108 RepID=UPI0011471100|nr:DUF3592 domain-containing protein [Actinomadura sp. WMMA1423]
MSVWVFVVVMVAFGGASVFGGVHQYRTSRAFLARAHRVPGIVVGIHRVPGDDSYDHFPVLRFRTLEGAEIETVAQSSGGSFELERLEGRPVAVLYDPRDPRAARMDTRSGRALAASAGAVAVGCVFALVGIAVLIAAVT